MRIASAGHALFAATMVGLGILCLVQGNFAPVWSPVGKGVPAREALVYLCAVVSVGTGAGLVWRRTSVFAARVLLAWLLLWLLVFRVPGLVLMPGLGTFWSASATAVMVAGAWVLYSWFAADTDRRYAGFVASEKGVRIARMLFGLALIVFGLAHFIGLTYTTVLIPDWLPWHVAFAYLTGSALIAAGVAVLAGVYARLAAVLATAEIGAFLVLVWVPRVAAGNVKAFQWNETVVTWALMAGAWVVADSYRGLPWLGRGER